MRTRQRRKCPASPLRSHPSLIIVYSNLETRAHRVATSFKYIDHTETKAFELAYLEMFINAVLYNLGAALAFMDTQRSVPAHAASGLESASELFRQAVILSARSSRISRSVEFNHWSLLPPLNRSTNVATFLSRVTPLDPNIYPDSVPVSASMTRSTSPAAHSSVLSNLTNVSIDGDEIAGSCREFWDSNARHHTHIQRRQVPTRVDPLGVWLALCAEEMSRKKGRRRSGRVLHMSASCSLALPSLLTLPLAATFSFRAIRFFKPSRPPSPPGGPPTLYRPVSPPSLPVSPS